MLKALLIIGLMSAMALCGGDRQPEATEGNNDTHMAERVNYRPAGDTVPEKIELSEEEWRKRLSGEEFEILRKAGTERAFSGKYWDYKKDGVYTCAGCGLPLFDSQTKFKSGTGWPSYYRPISPENVLEKEDRSLGMTRIEVLCARCEGHLGHVFNDGPEPTGLRYCLNSAALDFVARDSIKN